MQSIAQDIDTADALEFFKQVWKASTSQEVVDPVLSNTNLWGTDLTQIPGLSKAVKESVQYIESESFIQ